MSNKQIAGAIRPHNPHPMQLNRSLLREPVHNQKLIQRIFQRPHLAGNSRERLLVHLERCLTKASVY
jgi:hypothetical protein